MPFKSKAQQRYLHWLSQRGGIDPKIVKEFDKATSNFKKLPEKVKKKSIKDIIKK